MTRPDEQQRRELVEGLVHELVTKLPSLEWRPVSTYRLQLNKDFGFRDAAAVIPYLKGLGITDVYAAPYLKAAPGSPHGYDVVDHTVLNPELGTPDDHALLVKTLDDHGMRHIVDFVPNHMAIGSHNPYWMDVLENGPSSIYAHYFDIEWKPVKEELLNRVLVPTLGDQYGSVLERGELVVSFEAGAFSLSYFDNRFPITPRQYPQILRHRVAELEKRLPSTDVNLQDLLSIINACEKLPLRSETDAAKIVERNREKEVIKRRLIALCEGSLEIRAFIDENVRLFNGTPGEPRSFDLLDGLLREQAYRLAYWRVAAEEINYRRFFDVNSLAAIRMEDPRVLQDAHRLIFELIRDGKLAGLRIDHPDGLFGPTDYFRRLQEEYSVAICARLFRERAARDPFLLGAAEDGTPVGIDEAWGALELAVRERCHAERKKHPDGPLGKPLYLVVEKILAHDEKMPTSWAVHGTTGYDFMNQVNGLFVDRRAEKELDELFNAFTGTQVDYGELIYAKKRQIMADALASEMNVLARQLNFISELDRRTRDFTLNSLKRALVELVACFPVYRTYVDSSARPDEHDIQYVEQAVRRAKRKNPTLNASIFDFIRDVLLMKMDGYVTEEAKRARLAFVLKLQQVTAPVMAKGVEDTAFYVYNRLISLNEVGGEPNVFGISVEEFHRENAGRQHEYPGSLNATSTHDTKRSEDVRARIDVLSELAPELRRRVTAWSKLNAKLATEVHERTAPDKSEELLLYQTLLGAFPFERPEGEALDAFKARIQAYMQKALKEAKVNTSWMNPDEDWDKAVGSFIDGILDPKRSEKFLKDFLELQKTVARAGAVNALSQVLLKVTSPGVPDLYQGNELWDFSLVDPDNRRQVDFAKRRALMEALDERLAEGSREALCRELMEKYEDGRVKLHVTREALRLRRTLSEVFAKGEYLPLVAAGEKARHAVAFARRHGAEAVVVVAPRLVTKLLERDGALAGEAAWGDTFIEAAFLGPGEHLVDAFTGRSHQVELVNGRIGFSLKKLFRGFPVVLLVSPHHAEGSRVQDTGEASGGR